MSNEIRAGFIVAVIGGLSALLCLAVPLGWGRIPAFQQDWIWPVTQDQALFRLQQLGSAWINEGLGAPNETPSVNPAVYLPMLFAWLFGPALGLWLFLCAVGALAVLNVALAGRAVYSVSWPLGAIVGLAYVLSPITYNKFGAGHVLFLVSYALLPLVIWSTVRAARAPSIASSVALGFVMASASAQLQFLLLACVLAIAVSSSYGPRRATTVMLPALAVLALILAPACLRLLAVPLDQLGIVASVPLFVRSQSSDLWDALTGLGYIGRYATSATEAQPALLWGIGVPLGIRVALACLGCLLLPARVAVPSLVAASLAVIVSMGTNGFLAELMAYFFANVPAAMYLRELYNNTALSTLLIALMAGACCHKVIAGLRQAWRVPAMMIASSVLLAPAVLFAISPISVRITAGAASTAKIRDLVATTSGRTLILPAYRPLQYLGRGRGLNPFAWVDGAHVDAASGTGRSWVQWVSAKLQHERSNSTARALLHRYGVASIVVDQRVADGYARDARPFLSLRGTAPRGMEEFITGTRIGPYIVALLPNATRVQGAEQVRPFPGDLSDVRGAGTFIDRPGLPATSVLSLSTDDPADGFANLANREWFEGAAFAGTDHPAVTTRLGASTVIPMGYSRVLARLPSCGLDVEQHGSVAHVSRTRVEYAWYNLPVSEKLSYKLRACGPTGIEELSRKRDIAISRYVSELDVIRYWCQSTTCDVRVSTNRMGLLVLEEAYDAGWTLRTEDGQIAQHVRVDGALNGWLLPRAGRFAARISYAPATSLKWLLVAMAASMLAIALVLSLEARRYRTRTNTAV